MWKKLGAPEDQVEKGDESICIRQREVKNKNSVMGLYYSGLVTAGNNDEGEREARYGRNKTDAG